MTGSKFLTAALYATSLTNLVLGSQQPWLDKSLPDEERLQIFIAQLNTTQKLAMTQGDTEVSNPSDSHNDGTKIESMLTVTTLTA
jgi:hypothetical protein